MALTQVQGGMIVPSTTLTTPIVATTMGVGGATPASSGAGITFPATQSASSDANTLDDYEEGTFSPTVIGTVTAGTASYTIRNGRYTKIGRLVQFELYLSWVGGTGSGELRITNLPFTCSAGQTYPAVAVAYPNTLALTANNVVNAYMQDNNPTVFISQYPVGGGSSTGVAYDANAEILLCGSYSI